MVCLTGRNQSPKRSVIAMWNTVIQEADKSLARPRRKQTNISVRMVWISFGALPCRKKKNLMTTRVSMLLKSRASLTCLRACFLPGRAEDLSEPRYSYLLTYLFTCVTYSLTYLLTPWSTVLLEKLIGSQLVKEFPTFYWTRRFITAITRPHHLSLSKLSVQFRGF